jgi:hypothetical protein
MAKARQKIRREGAIGEIYVAIKEIAVRDSVRERPREARVAHRTEPPSCGPEASDRRRDHEYELG